ncbi:MAG: NADH-quinone oxidoreductase subunit C, partial [Polyangiales bacterium]
MSQVVVDRLKARFGARVLASDNFRGDDEVLVAPADWLEAARFLRDDAECAMNHFIDITAADYPEREPEIPRFDVLLFVRSLGRNHRIRLKTQVGEG